MLPLNFFLFFFIKTKKTHTGSEREESEELIDRSDGLNPQNVGSTAEISGPMLHGFLGKCKCPSHVGNPTLFPPFLPTSSSVRTANCELRTLRFRTRQERGGWCWWLFHFPSSPWFRNNRLFKNVIDRTKSPVFMYG